MSSAPTIVGPDAFAQEFVRLEDGRPLILEPWQTRRVVRPLFYTLDPATGLRRFNLALIGVGKKNGKSTLAALIALYLLLADGEPEPEVYGAAADRDQARVVMGQVKRFVERSPELSRELTIYRDAIERKDGAGVYRVLSADAPSAHGLNPHGVIFDELWNQRTYDLWEALTHSPARKQPLHFCITYAGYDQRKGSLLWDLYQRGLKGEDPGMLFVWFDGDQANPASWITPAYLEQQRRRLPEHVFKRLHRNEWTSGTGSFLTREDVTASLDLELGNTFSGQGQLYFAAVDLGLVNDATAVVVVHRDPVSQKVILDHVQTFKGSPTSPVVIGQVEEHLYALHQHFDRLGMLRLDPYQAVSMMQRLEERGLPVDQFNFSAGNITRLTQNLFQLFKDRRIALFEHDELINELLTVKVVEKSYGIRIDHEHGRHDDHVIALGMAALAAMETPTAKTMISTAWIEPGPAPGVAYIVVPDPALCGARYRFALEAVGTAERVRAFCPEPRADGSGCDFTQREFPSREAFAAYLRHKHGALRFRRAA
ncbi:MAG: hypothetical protein K9K66_07610 [Desulfarculaceae bacterium]|nr:hypothetical protein [Desulfarculaceae bacterium]MCF8071991.1 hypothetical protein [Desulfarculaceae bacterium]MCF8101508.1 hypothetical protein [Desulfarculaceae bacterium]MCF8115058.1 hypothetical protein [Desulfarculaceae bacterium]